MRLMPLKTICWENHAILYYIVEMAFLGTGMVGFSNTDHKLPPQYHVYTKTQFLRTKDAGKAGPRMMMMC